MLSAVLMLIHLKELEAAKRLQAAVEKVYAAKQHTTGDVGGHASTEEFTDAVIANLS
jgi:isocitrate/isopropylmalate dehydrogenase